MFFILGPIISAKCHILGKLGICSRPAGKHAIRGELGICSRPAGKHAIRVRPLRVVAFFGSCRYLYSDFPSFPRDGLQQGGLYFCSIHSPDGPRTDLGLQDNIVAFGTCSSMMTRYLEHLGSSVVKPPLLQTRL